MAEISKNIKKFRKESEMTQQELAEKLNVTRQTVSNWENGKTQPDIDMLQNIAGELQITNGFFYRTIFCILYCFYL